jgi:hypothetical protein
MIKLTLAKRQDGKIQSIIVNENFIVKIVSTGNRAYYGHPADPYIVCSQLTLLCAANVVLDEIVRETPDQILELINNQTLALKLQQELYGEVK